MIGSARSEFPEAPPADALSQLAAVRVTVGAVVAVLVSAGPYGPSLSVLAPSLYRPLSHLPLPLYAPIVQPLRWVTIASAVATAIGFRPRVSVPFAAFVFGAFNALNAGFTSSWSYNTHLNLALLLLAVCYARPASDGAPCAERAGITLHLLRLMVGLIYFQAGLSKVLVGGWAWFWTGDTPRAFALHFGTELGRALPPEVFAAGALATGVLELGFLPVLLVARRAAPVLAAVAWVFHLSTWLVMGISFWHLWALFPALFFWRGARR